MTTLDTWDCKVIRLFKHADAINPVTIEKLLDIWSERVDMEVEYIHLGYITEHFLNLAKKLDLFNKYENQLFDFIMSLKPDQNWKYVCTSRQYLGVDETDFNLILLSRLDSLFSLTEVKYLPGYAEFVDSLK